MAATAPLIVATCAQRDAIAVMTALRSYGGLNFSTACYVLIRDFSEIYPEWTKLAKIVCVIPVSSVQNRIKTAQRSRLRESEVTSSASCGETLHAFETCQGIRLMSFYCIYISNAYGEPTFFISRCTRI